MTMRGDARDDELILPELHEALLDGATLLELLFDVESAAELLEIRVKGQAERCAGDCRASLAEAAELLMRGSVAGIQLRYLFQGAEWCDTLMPATGGARLVRMRAPVGRARAAPG